MKTTIYTKRMLLIGFIGLIISACFYPGLSGPFVLDDQLNIIDNDHIKITEWSADQIHFAATTPIDGYQYSRTLSYLSFALNYYLSGFQLNSYDFKATNLFIHFVNALLLLLISIKVLKIINPNRDAPFLLLATTITLTWACHPLLVSSVLYAVQRMTILAGSTTLLGCYCYLLYRSNTEKKPHHLPLLTLTISSLIIIGFHFKESAILLPAYILCLELLIRPFCKKDRNLDRTSIAIALTAVIFAAIYLVREFGNIANSYIFREFTLDERLLTQPRVLFWYLKLILLPQLSDFSLFLDNFPISRGINTPVSTVYAIGGWILLLIGGAITRYRRIALATLGWFLAGHSIESSFIPLEIAFEHRNYIPSIAPIFVVVNGIYFLLAKITNKTVIKVIALSAILLICCIQTFVRASYWGDAVKFVVYSVENRPTSVRARATAGLFYATRDPAEALKHFQVATTHHPNAVSPLINQRAIYNTIINLYERIDIDDQKYSESDEAYKKLIAFKKAHSLDDLKEIRSSIDKRINQNLVLSPVSAQIISSLNQLINCRVSSQIACPESDIILEWVNTALANPRKKPLYRSFLLFFRARLVTYEGYPEEGIEIMEALVEQHPSVDFFADHLLLMREATLDSENQKNRL